MHRESLDKNIKHAKLLEEAIKVILEMENDDITAAKNLTVNSTRAEFVNAVGMGPNKFFRIYRTLFEVIYNTDGTYTKFATMYNIRSFEDLYEVMKKVKRLMLTDHMEDGWDKYIRLMYMVAYPKLIKKGLFDDPVHAINFVQRTIYEVLDDLRIMKKVFKIMQYMETNPEYKKVMYELERKFNVTNEGIRQFNRREEPNMM
jgi:hypothetical protein